MIKIWNLNKVKLTIFLLFIASLSAIAAIEKNAKIYLEHRIQKVKETQKTELR